MTIITPVQVEHEIMRLCGRLEALTEELASKGRTAALTDAKYKAAHAKERLISDRKTVAEREVAADLATLNEYTAKRIAEEELRVAIDAGRNIRAQLDALRSVNANTRAAVGL